MSYSRPIIVEIYADLFLEPGTLTFARFFDLVPHLQRHGFAIVESTEKVLLNLDVAAGSSFGAAHLPRVRCWSADRSKLIQVAPDNITMNLVSPDGSYPGWNAFMADVFAPATEALRSSLPSWRTASIALHTLDRTTVVPDAEFRLGQYLNCGGPRLPSVLADTKTAFDYEIGRGLLQVDGRNRQLHVNGEVTTDGYLIQMQAVLHDTIREEDAIGTVLDRLHDESVIWFESLITDRMRHEIMRGEANAGSRL